VSLWNHPACDSLKHHHRVRKPTGKGDFNFVPRHPYQRPVRSGISVVDPTINVTSLPLQEIEESLNGRRVANICCMSHYLSREAQPLRFLGYMFQRFQLPAADQDGRSTLGQPQSHRPAEVPATAC